MQDDPVVAQPTGFYCRTCGQYHEGLPMSIAYDLPEGLVGTPDGRPPGVEMTNDWCYIEAPDEDVFLVRGCLEIPVLDSDETFVWSVWVTLSEDNFLRMRDLWTDESRVDEPSYFGWLMTNIPAYPETALLKTSVQTRAVGLRPAITLEPTDHPLAVEQWQGITMERVQEIVGMALHPHTSEDVAVEEMQ